MEAVNEGLGLAARDRVITFVSSGDVLYASTGSRSGVPGYRPNIFLIHKDKTKWEELGGEIAGTSMGALAVSEDVLYAGSTSSGLSVFDSQRTPSLFRLNHLHSGKTWERLAAGTLRPDHSHLGRPRYSEVILVGTSEGLFWSTDEGRRFRKYSPSSERKFRYVGAIQYEDRTAFISTDRGVFYLLDFIPRGTWYARAYHYILGHQWVFSGLFLECPLMVVLSTRLILIFLQLDLWPIKSVAPWFYLLPLGRWKLFRKYRTTLSNERDIKEDADRYVDLPYRSNDYAAAPSKLSALFDGLSISKRVVVIADGGRGKSTLGHYLSIKSLKSEKTFGVRHLEPVIIDGLSYSGDMLESVTAALKRHKAYVNPAIEGLLEAGHLLIIFDGFSEIRESYQESGNSSDIPPFVQHHPDTPFVITSRSELPPPLQLACGDFLHLELRDVDEKTERGFLQSIPQARFA